MKNKRNKMDLLKYLLLATSCLSISYMLFLIFYRNTTGFQQQRIFLLVSVAVSLIFPLIGIRLNIAEIFPGSTISSHEIRLIVPAHGSRPVPPAGSDTSFLNIESLGRIYLTITTAFIVVIAIHLVKILRLYIISGKTWYRKSIILSNDSVDSPFSFFSWIFIPEGISDREERESIIIHESIHVSQYHSIDNLLIELISAVMWFNPLVWMMKRSVHLLHEYLADEGTLSAGIDRIRYQALLINQVTEERLICLSSDFNRSLIKKRMIMMTKSRSNSRNKSRILTLIPLSMLLLLVVSVLNGLFPQKAEARATEPGQLNFSSGFPAPVQKIQNDTVKKKNVKVKVVKKEEKRIDSEKIEVIVEPGLRDSVVYIVDGNRRSDIGKINPDSIESVTVIKKNNEVIINMIHPEEESHEKIVVKNDRLSFPDNVIVVIDGKTVTKEEVKNLNPDNIESIEVLKDDSVKKADHDVKCDGIIKIVTRAAPKNQ